MTQTNDLDQTRLALAALTAALAQTLGESDKSFPSRLIENLQKVYGLLREGPASNLGAMETVKSAEQFLQQMS